MLYVKGAADVLINRITSSDEEKAVITQRVAELSEKGLRILAFAEKKFDKDTVCPEDEDGLEFVGLIAMMDPPREESKAAVAECRKAGIKPVMITGDHIVTASAIAREIGILDDNSKAVEGHELDAYSDEELVDFVKDKAVYARVTPEHKIRIVKAWQANGCIVSMTGDGVNDAPALKQADVGVAMGITGTEVSKDAASMVLADDNFATIVKAIRNGRNIYENIKKAILFLLSGNFAAILVVLFNSLLGLPVPFAAIHLLFINLLTDSLPAIGLGLEPHSEEVMKRKPRKRKRIYPHTSFPGRDSIVWRSYSDSSSFGFPYGKQDKRSSWYDDGIRSALLCKIVPRIYMPQRILYYKDRYPLQPLECRRFLRRCPAAWLCPARTIYAWLIHDCDLTVKNVLSILGLAFIPTFIIQITRIIKEAVRK